MKLYVPASALEKLYVACVGFGGSERRRDMRLELHQHHPPTARTGTTYSIEMYQCIRHASGVIPAKSITRSPRLPGRRLLGGEHIGVAPAWGVHAARARGRPGAAAAYEQHEQQPQHGDRDAEHDHRG